MSINIELVQEYLSYKIPAPERFIFLIDRSHILSELTEFHLNDELVQVIHYENDLQLRLELEWVKDEFTENCYCIVSNKSDEDNLYILDFISRSSQVNVTPQDILNFVGQEHWTEAANWLRGDDFWRSLDVLVRIKDKPNLSLLDRDRAYLASALLDTDFTRRFDAAAGFIFYFKKMASTQYSTFKEHYPQLAAFIEQKLFTDVPELKPFVDQPELLNSFWLGYPPETAHKILDPERSFDLKYELAIKVPYFVRDQIDLAESAYFKSATNVDEFLDSQLTSDTLDGWTEYIRKETMLFEPLKAVLKRILETLIRKPDLIDLEKLSDTAETLQSHLAFRTKEYEEAASQAKSPAQMIFILFNHCIRFYCCLRKGKQTLLARSTDSFENLQQLFVTSIAKLPLLMAQIIKQNQNSQFLAESMLQKTKRDYQKLLADSHKRFTEFVEQNYPAWLHKALMNGQNSSDDNRQCLFPFQFIRDRLSNSRDRPLYLLIFDGMRWDGWEYLRAQLESIWYNRKKESFPMMTVLPSTTQFCRPFLISGKMPSNSNHIDEWEVLKKYLGIAATEIIKFAENQLDSRALEQLLQSPAPLKILIFDIFDKKVHTSDQTLDGLYQEIELEFQRSVRPILESLPKDSVILLFSDHGFIESLGKIPFEKPGSLTVSRTDQHRRYAETQRSEASRDDFVYFTFKELGLLDDDRNGYAFIRNKQIFQLAQKEKFVRYAHGGISMEEMIVPVVSIEAVSS